MLHIVRHGRTEHNASGLLLGRIDPPLDDLGRDQAAALAAARKARRSRSDDWLVLAAGSLVATLAFMATAMVTVLLARHL